MTKKDFHVLASALAASKPKATQFLTETVYKAACLQWNICMKHVIRVCILDNPKFKTSLFIKTVHTLAGESEDAYSATDHEQTR